MALFETSEYLVRIKKTKDKMDEAGIDVLVVADPANMNYLTGYDGWSFYVPQVVVVSLESKEPVWIGREMDTYFFSEYEALTTLPILHLPRGTCCSGGLGHACF